MLRVFLVEDEYAMRERMKKNIMWEENGFTLVGEAGDGELAYPMICELEPDILITDIRMPFMNGLELTRLVKESLPQLKILILSGYDEFEYAKEAIGLGVTDYLLKPITSKKLLESLHQVAQIIQVERQQELRCKMSHLQIQKQKFFRQLISGSCSVQQIIEHSKELEFDLRATSYQMMILKIVTTEDVDTRWKQMVEECFIKDSCFIFSERSGFEYLILVKGKEEQLKDMKQFLILRLTQALTGNPLLRYYIGIGKRVTRISEIPASYETATQAIAYSYLNPNHPISHYEDCLSTSKEQLNLNEVLLPSVTKKQFKSFLYQGDLHEVSTFLNAHFEGLNASLDSYLFRQYLIVDIYFMITSFCYELNIPIDVVESIFERYHQLNGILHDQQAYRKTIEYWLIQCLMVRDANQVKGNALIIAQVKNYLQENYNKEGLSLNQVADAVKISSSHLSTIFSQETGQTFISYLTEIRMKKAKELLRGTDMKTLEIGYEVGYKDAHYFSSLFKKTQHCTPKEYRSLKDDVE